MGVCNIRTLLVGLRKDQPMCMVFVFMSVLQVPQVCMRVCPDIAEYHR